MSDHEELLSQFVGVTNADRDFARSFLEAGKWDLNEALNLYLGGGGAAPSTTTTAPPRVPTMANTNMGSNATLHAQPAGDSLAAAREASLTDRANQIMSEQGLDYQTARAIAEAEGGGGIADTSDGVRAPILATSGRLIESTSNFSRAAGGTTFRDFEAETRAMEAMIARGNSSLGNSAQLAAGRNGNMNMNAAVTSASPHTSNSGASRAGNLQDLFSPPRDMLFQGTWDEARAHGKASSRWLLVNIQQDSQFLSYVLNRDLWSNEIIKDTIKHSFVFFQHEESNAEAQRYKTYYKPNVFPHVAIIDPFTGEQMIVLDLARFQSDATDLRSHFLEKVQQFLEKNKLHGAQIKNMQDNVMKKYEAEAAKTNNSSATKRQKQESKPQTEGQMLGSPTNESVPMEDVKDGGVVEPEPPAGENVTTVQFRLFDGRRLRRRFRKDRKIADLFAYVRSEFPDARRKPFDLIGYPPRSLLPLKDKTLLDERVLNTTLSAKYV
mmetsp:Transcript_5804/g.7628  ORF Transcript_5804/g.7628 Transcript_5804/m.7628 type:complete len:495 (+) Transcript_5804:142-1626(+)|eukprot:CAMPEP_0204841270 /NCGR_PEP_ID=MMETSP1346-20131115/41352_1 /ASSEMBLY_ACC=CAM_ASM_000771 /TAXON_ID=215587 /ORGANISM="Aplanochytrium stocchinoi, Strain GSBS06" /LENGTH=494 /DNA_ID=CAMNT_0051979295 /DNA_START=550 /DNA_END=2034 /DNA_ORIENTATION=-